MSVNMYVSVKNKPISFTNGVDLRCDNLFTYFTLLKTSHDLFSYYEKISNMQILF